MKDILLNIFIILVGIALVSILIYGIKIIIKIRISNINLSKRKYTPIIIDLYTKLKSELVEDILLKDDFVIKKKYYKSIRPGKYVTEYIEDLANEILNYLNINHRIDVIVLYDENNRYNSKKEKAGYYRSNRIKRDIHIVVKKDYACRDIAAILCHEISHLYMELMGIEYEDKAQNEEATDIVAIILGFGKIMINGYIEHEYEESMWDGRIKKHTSRIGYISCEDCKIIYSLVKEIKEAEIAKKHAEIILNETKKEIIEKLELAKDLYDRFLDVAQNKTTGSVSQSDFVKLQELFMKIENGYFSLQFDQFHNKLTRELTKEELEEIGKKIDLLCYEITLHNSFLAKH